MKENKPLPNFEKTDYYDYLFEILKKSNNKKEWSIEENIDRYYINETYDLYPEMAFDDRKSVIKQRQQENASRNVLIHMTKNAITVHFFEKLKSFVKLLYNKYDFKEEKDYSLYDLLQEIIKPYKWNDE